MNSPWGNGRPGWHIECSAMASQVFNQPTIDVHCGGIDLRFPHHDNELAQSEAHFCNHQWVNYFFHTGRLDIKGKKMSKSEKNFVTIAEALKSHTSRSIRMLYLLRKFQDPMEYSPDSMENAIQHDKKFSDFFSEADKALRQAADQPHSSQKWSSDEFNLLNQLHSVKRNVHEALCDSFDTPTAIEQLGILVDAANKYRVGNTVNGPLYRSVAQYVTDMFKVFGMIEDKIGFSVGDSNDQKPLLDAFTNFRYKVRNAARDKQLQEKGETAKFILKECDIIRDKVLPLLGAQIDDVGENSSWRPVDPQTVMKNMEVSNIQVFDF
jgi:cysteinyl-tRNA synthetase